METAELLITALLTLISATSVLRGLYCVYKWRTDEEQSSQYKKRLVNLLIFSGIAGGFVSFLYVLLDYVT